MGIADEADRTLFVGNLDPQVTEELLFELFLQAGPLIKVKIPKDNDGKPKQFGFVNFKHEVSVPYGMNLLNGTRLFGRPLKIQFRAGSSHLSQEGNSPGWSQNHSPTNTPPLHGGRLDRTPDLQGSPSFPPAVQLHRAFSSPESLQRQAMMNNMWQLQLQQLQQLEGAVCMTLQQQQHGGRSGGGNPWQHESPAHRGSRHGHYQDGGGQHSREQRYGNDGSNDRHRRDGQRGDCYQHDDRSGGRNRDYHDRRRDPRDGSRDGRWRRY